LRLMFGSTKTTGAASVIAVLVMLFVLGYARSAVAASFDWLPALTTSEDTTRLTWQLAPRVTLVMERRSEYEGAAFESPRIDTRALLQVTWRLPRRRARNAAPHFARCNAACDSAPAALAVQ
jgi:hypothetical protein